MKTTRRIVALTFLITTAVVGVATPAFAASNPAGTGQPGTANPNGVACGDANATAQPAGFGTAGFANAASRYAGSPGTGSLNSNNTHAVSEYDIACYQVTQRP